MKQQWNPVLDMEDSATASTGEVPFVNRKAAAAGRAS
jgi:hypothetical protein